MNLLCSATIIAGVFLGGWRSTGTRIETPGSLRAAPAQAIVVQDDERHAAVTFIVSEAGLTLREVKVGRGPSRTYARENKPVVIELLDWKGTSFDRIRVDDPRELRVYNDVSQPGSPPHGVVRLKQAEGTIVLPLDPRLDAIRITIEPNGPSRPLAVSDVIAKQCAGDASEPCQTFLLGRSR